MGKKLKYEDVYHEFESRGYQLLDDKHISSVTPMRFICPKHGVQSIYFGNLKSGSGCKLCSIERRATKSRYSVEDVAKMIEKQGYTMLDDKYINNDTNIRCLCPKHGEFYVKLRHLNEGHACKKCGFDKNRGSKNKSWTGGHWKSDLMFRHLMKPWVQECLSDANYTCEITGKRGKLNVHHMFPFKEILKLTLEDVGIDYKDKFGEYTQQERDIILSRLDYNNRKLAQPVVMLESIHKKFHQFCGGNRKPTSFEQLAEFKRLVREGVISV